MTTECDPPCGPNAAESLPVVPLLPTAGPAPVVTVAPTTATGVNCANAPVTATGIGVVQSVPHPTAVQNVRICNAQEFDKSILCDPTDGRRIVLVTTYSATGVPTSVAYELSGAVYPNPITGLVQCADADTESDAVEMCDGGNVTFIRWVVKRNGQPTGVVFDTTIAGVPYAPAGVVTVGSCQANAPVPLLDCVNINSSPVVQSVCDRTYRNRSSGLIAPGAYVLAPGIGLIRSYTIMVAPGATVAHTNGPNNGVVYPAGTYSWSAPMNGAGTERGFLPGASFTTTGQVMILWTEG